MFKKKVQIKAEQPTKNNDSKSYDIYFDKSDVFLLDFKKAHKLVNTIVIEGIKHSTFIGKRTKAIKGFSFRFLSLCVYDILSKGTSRGYYFSSKTKELLFFTISDNDRVSIEVSPNIESEAVFIAVENMFLGNPYVEISGDEKELSSLYIKSQALMLVVLLVAIVGVFYVAYTTLIENNDVTTVVQKIPPEKPVPVPLTLAEENILKNKLSMDIIKLVKKEIDVFEERTIFDTKRISSIEINGISFVAPVEPTLDEEKNIWVYEGEAEKLRRGGFDAVATIEYQQKFPSDGYTLSIDESEEAIPFYRKIDIKTIHVYAVDIEKEDNNLTIKKLDDSCLNHTLRVVDRISPFSNNSNYIDFDIKNTLPNFLYKDIELLMEMCPLEFSTLSIKEGEFTSKVSMFKRGKIDSNQTNSSPRGML